MWRSEASVSPTWSTYNPFLAIDGVLAHCIVWGGNEEEHQLVCMYWPEFTSRPWHAASTPMPPGLRARDQLCFVAHYLMQAQCVEA